MIPKSGNRFSDKIMLKTKNPAHANNNQAWRTARLPPTSGRAGARAQPRPAWAGEGDISFAAPPSRDLAKRFHTIRDHAAVSAMTPAKPAFGILESRLGGFRQPRCSNNRLGWNDDYGYGFSQLVIFRSDY
jgi:hypothetical protein